MTGKLYNLKNIYIKMNYEVLIKVLLHLHSLLYKIKKKLFFILGYKKIITKLTKGEFINYKIK